MLFRSDHASGKIFIRHQVSLGASDTIASKHSVEHEASSHCVIIKKFHADNCIFDSGAFELKVEENNQQITFSGIGAQHQNAAAECAPALAHLLA